VAEDPIIEKLKHEILGLLLVALGILLFLSLISYHPADPSFFSYTSAKMTNIHNWMGVVVHTSPDSSFRPSDFLPS